MKRGRSNTAEGVSLHNLRTRWVEKFDNRYLYLKAEKNSNRENSAHEGLVRTYAIGDTLGSGSAGFVYQATHIPDGEQVALKILQRVYPLKASGPLQRYHVAVKGKPVPPSDDEDEEVNITRTSSSESNKDEE